MGQGDGGSVAAARAQAEGAGAAALRGWRNWVDTDTVAVKGAIEKLLLAKP